MKIVGRAAFAVTLLLACGTQALAQQKAVPPAQAAPPVEVGFVVLNVSDMDKSVAYYKLMGFTVSIQRGDKPKRATAFQQQADMRSGGLVLLEREGPVTHGDGLARVGIRTHDAVAVCKRLADAGTPCFREPKVVPQDQGAIIGMAKDPDGYTLEIVQQPK